MQVAKPRIRVKANSTPIVPNLPVPVRGGRTTARYMRTDNTPFFLGWNPVLREASQETREAYYAAASRAIDTIHNSGWIAGGVDQAVAGTVGASGLRLASKPDAEALGWTADEAQDWAKNVERRWEGFANRPIECDVEGKATVGKMQGQALRSFFAYGEVLATIPFVRRRGIAQYGTKVQMLPPHRLLMQDNVDINMLQGVRRDPWGFPLGYRIGLPPQTFPMQLTNYRDMDARDPYGRVSVVHVFDGMIGQLRGVPPITPALKVVRQFDQLSDATLVSALLQTIFSATIKTNDPTEIAQQAFTDVGEQAVAAAAKKPRQPDGTPEAVPTWFELLNAWRNDYYDTNKIDLGAHGKIAHLAPGDELVFNSTQHPNANFDPFTRFLLREIARSLGITYEEMTGDFTGATYSSVRMGGAYNYLITTYRRVNIIAPFVQPVFEAWLEEDIENGWTPFPGGVDAYIENRAAASRANWRGPAKPQADDEKFAKAVQILMGLGLVTAEWACAELGDDWEDTFEQLKREQDKRDKLKLPPPVFAKGLGGDGSNPVDPAVEPKTPAVA
jgi:lambda family phage portal protein